MAAEMGGVDLGGQRSESNRSGQGDTSFMVSFSLSFSPGLSMKVLYFNDSSFKLLPGFVVGVSPF